MMDFGGVLPNRIKFSNADAPYLPLIIEDRVVAMVLMDTIVAQYNDKIEALTEQLNNL